MLRINHFRILGLGLALAAAPACRAQLPANLLPTADGSGSYVHTTPTEVKVVEVSQTGLTLECSQQAIPGLQPFTWREKYAVQGGKLVLESILTPHVAPPQPAHTEWQVSTAIGTPNIGPAVLDPQWNRYAAYLQGVIQAVQDEWAHEVADSHVPSSSGSAVSVSFVMNSKGEVVQILGARSSASSPMGVVDPCVRAINGRAPYGAWSDDMIAALGNQQQVTLSFYYQ